MPKRLKKAPRDPNQFAKRLVDLTTQNDEPEGEPILAVPPEVVSEYMAHIGRRGGVVSGQNRIRNFSAAKRSEIALRAATVRWEKERAKKRAAKKR